MLERAAAALAENFSNHAGSVRAFGERPCHCRPPRPRWRVARAVTRAALRRRDGPGHLSAGPLSALHAAGELPDGVAVARAGGVRHYKRV